MNRTGLIDSWSGAPDGWGPLYPFVGHERLMLLLCLAFCIGFVIWKFVEEHRRYEYESRSLRETIESHHESQD